MWYNKNMNPEDFQEIIARMSENAQKSLERAEFYSREFKTGYIGIEHVLLGILDNRESSATLLAYRYNLKFENVYDFLVESPLSKHRIPAPEDPNMRILTDRAAFAIKMASLVSGNSEEITTKNLLFSIIKQKNLQLQVMLRKIGTDIDGLSAILDEEMANEGADDNIRNVFNSITETETIPKQQSGREITLLKKFGEDLTQKAKDNELDPVIGREIEVQRLITILLRRTKSNPVLIGEAGVGKTAVVELLAQKIASGKVPHQLVNKKIFEIDLAGMLAGTKFRGQFEERLKNVISALEKHQEIIAFIDEIHLLTGTGSADGAMDAANILKPALARGRTKLIGATTFDEYKKTIEKDSALTRRFQSIRVDEPSLKDTLEILKGLREKYEKYHGVVISDEILSEIVDMSARYVFDRQMPDKAIDTLDEASALLVSKNSLHSNKIVNYLHEIDELKKKKMIAEFSEKDLVPIYESRILQLEKKITEEKKRRSKTKRMILTSDLVAKAISLKTNIPVRKISKNQAKVLKNLEKHLSKKVIGQSEAIEQISKAIRRNKSGLSDENRPIGSFIFLGPSGVGKTELSRQLAEEVFGGSKSLIKIDMSEFGEKHKTSQLLGAPAGYVGYGEGGTLTEKIRRQPYSVVLFDEIEKAHPDVFNLLLQLLEDGELTDSQGRKVSFKNTVIILTSNLGANEIMRENSLGFEAENSLEKSHAKNKKLTKKALSKFLKPELLNRFDGIITFKPLSKKEIGQIFELLLADLNNRLLRKGLNLKVRKAVKDRIIEKGYDSKNGVRPLRRTIEDLLEYPLAEEILDKNPPEGTQFIAAMWKGEIKIEISKE